MIHSQNTKSGSEHLKSETHQNTWIIEHAPRYQNLEFQFPIKLRKPVASILLHRLTSTVEVDLDQTPVM